jgi:uncharacterized protein YjbI with pentapeptide repeats
MADSGLEHQKLVRLRDLMIEHFNLQDLQLFCFNLDIEYEDLAGTTLSAKTQNLVTYLQRRGLLQRLVEELKNLRPGVDWPELAPKAGDFDVAEKSRGKSVSGDRVGGDKITTGDISDVSGAGIGKKAQGLSAGNVSGSVIQAQGDVTIGRSQRDEQYDVALNWDGQRRMRGYDLAGRDLSGLNLANSDLRGADLVGTDLSKTDLSDADLSGAKLRGAKLAESDLSRAVLNGADLEDANLWNAKLINARLLDRTIMLHANLTGANLYKVKIFAGVLHGAHLNNANLRQAEVLADVSNADLSGADLQGADLSKVGTIWQVMSLVGAKYDGDTKWPDGFNPKDRGAILVDNSNPPADTGHEVLEKNAAADTYIDAKIGLEMIRIPAGNFLYGEDNRLEYLPEFWIAKTPVTNAQYFEFVRATGHDSPEHWQGETPKSEIAEHPVVHVSYGDAAAFADWAGMDLPDEKEWEKAARGTKGRVYPWGNEWGDGYCNTSESGIGTTTPVGRYSPQGDSPYGCVDMAGNVYDWTVSWYEEGEGWRVLRGGSWNFEQAIAAATYRDGTPHEDRINDIGFRLVVRRFPSE